MRSLAVMLGSLIVATISPGQTPSWTQIKPTNSPPVGFDHAMEYDSLRQRTVLFAGILGRSDLGDTWEYGATGLTLTAINPVSVEFK